MSEGIGKQEKVGEGLDEGKEEGREGGREGGSHQLRASGDKNHWRGATYIISLG